MRRRVLAKVLAVTVACVGLLPTAAAPSVAAAPSAPSVPSVASTPFVPGVFVPLAPTRILDTRTASAPLAGPVPSLGVLSLPVLGAGGIPSEGVSAVVLNVTVTRPTAPGFVSVFPDQTTPPTASNLNFAAGQTIPNLVVAKVGANGAVAFRNGSSGTVQLLADVAGYYLADRADPPPARVPGAFTPLAPTRLLDTRSGQGAPGPVASLATAHLQVLGQGGVPASGVSAVVLNVTATASTSPGFVTVYPDGETKPTASNLNYPKAQTIPNLVVAKVGTNGQVALFNGGGGSTQLLADVAGYYTSGDPVDPGAFAALTPSRVLDTRSALGATGPVAAGGTVHLRVRGQGGLPAWGVSAVVLNVTATAPTVGGFVSVYPDGTSRPTTSSLNFAAGQTIPNLVVVPLGANGSVSLFNGTSGTVQLLADVAGYFRSDETEPTPPGPVTAVTATPSATSVALSWTNPTGPATSTYTGVTIRRATGSTPPASVTAGTLVADVAAPATTATDSGLASGTTYSYALFSHDGHPVYGAAATASTTTTAPSGLGSVSGTITDAAGTHHGLAGVTVKVSSFTTHASRTATTTADGRYVVSGLAPGTDYTACFTGWTATGGSADSFGYLFQCYRGQTSSGSVGVVADRTTSGIDAALAGGGVVSGSVTDASSRVGLGNVVVSISGYSLREISGNPQAVTAADGTYRVTGLATEAGYQVCFSPQSSTGGQPGAFGYGYQCFDRQATTATASRVAATALSTRSGVNGLLVPGGSIRGTVTDAAGSHRPLAGATVSVLGVESAAGTTTTAADGSYTLSGLSPGSYLVLVTGRDARGGSADTQGYVDSFYGGRFYDDATPVVVTSQGATSAINVALTPAGAIFGRVTDAEGTHLPLAGVRLEVRSDSASYYSSYSGAVTTAADGTYLVRGLPAASDYHVCYSPDSTVTGGSFAAYGYLRECWNDDRSGEGTAISVIAGSTRSAVDAGLSHGGAISGTLTEDGGAHARLGNVGVVAYPSQSASISTVTAADGTYRLIGLPAGSGYVVCFFPDDTTSGGTTGALGYAHECYVNKPTTAGATPITVTAGAVRSGVDAGLAAAGGIAGTVTDAGGTHHALAGVSVSAYSAVSQSFGSAVTSGDGTYRIVGLNPATDYAVCFGAPYDSVTGGSTDALGYQSECYDNKTGASPPTPVTVVAGQVRASTSGALSPAGAIAGTVTDGGGTHHGLAQVQVTVSSAAASVYSYATTDATGAYRVVGLPPATDYVVCFSGASATGGSSDGSGYTDECFDNKPDEATATKVVVTAGATRSGVDAALGAASGMAGTVTEDGGSHHGLAYVDVQAYSPTIGGSSFTFASTDANGRFVIRGLAPAADWTVCILVNSGINTVSGGSADATGYVPECWEDLPANTYPDDITPIRVTANTVTSGIDLTLADGGAITGHVVDPAGSPAPGINLSVYATDGTIAGYAVTDANGNYVAKGLLPGDLVVCSAFGETGPGSGPDGYPTVCSGNVPDRASATSVAVTARTTRGGVDLALSAGGAITGTVTDIGTRQGLGDVEVDVYHDGHYVTSAWTDSTGGYRVARLLGANSYSVCFAAHAATGGSSTAYDQECWDNKPDAESATPVAVTAGQVRSQVNAALVPQG